MTPQAAYALSVLGAMQKQLDAAVRSGMGALPLVASRAIDQPKRIWIQSALTSGGPVELTEDAPAFAVPLLTYALWRDAWSLVADTPWPLGDGERAIRDPEAAARMPPLLAGLTTTTTILVAAKAADWHPPVQPIAIAAAVIAAAGIGLSVYAAKHAGYLARQRR